jgi:hypothetical protein
MFGESLLGHNFVLWTQPNCLNFPPPALCKLKTTAIYFASRKYTHQNIDNENFTSNFYNYPLNLESLTKFNLPKPTERYTQILFSIIVMGILHLCEKIFICANSKFSFARKNKYFICAIFKMHWIINRWKWQIALEIFLTEWEILILVHNDSIY